MEISENWPPSIILFLVLWQVVPWRTNCLAKILKFEQNIWYGEKSVYRFSRWLNIHNGADSCLLASIFNIFKNNKNNM